jgi:hypothetical protein
MQQSPPTTHTICGLDHRDLALLVTACANWANFLAHLAAGHYDDDTAIRFGYGQDRRDASDDARRLQHIASTLHDRTASNATDGEASTTAPSLEPTHAHEPETTDSGR